MAIVLFFFLRKQQKSQQFLSPFTPPPLALCPSSELLICVAVMLKCSVRHYERQISCFSCRRTHAERLLDLCPSWWRRRAGASGTPYSCGLWWWGGGGLMPDGGVRWIARSGSLYPDAPGGMDTFYCCRWETDVRLWEGPFVSTLPPADTRRHWGDGWTANLWVPNRLFRVLRAAQKAAASFTLPGALVRLQIRTLSVTICLFLRHRITN